MLQILLVDALGTTMEEVATPKMVQGPLIIKELRLLIVALLFIGLSIVIISVKKEENYIEGKVKIVASPFFLLSCGSEFYPVLIRESTILIGIEGSLRINVNEKVKVVFTEKKGCVVIAKKIIKEEEPHLECGRGVFPSDIYSRKDEDYILLDVRAKEKFLRFHIKNAISMENFQMKDVMFQDKKDIIIVGKDAYDEEAITLLQSLVEKGKKNVFILNGGIEGWNSSNYPLVMEADYLINNISKIKNLIIIDLRNRLHYESGHIPLSFNLSIEEMKWNEFSMSSGMPAILFYGEDESDEGPFIAAEKVLNWRVSKGLFLDEPVLILKGGYKKYKKLKGPYEKGFNQNSIYLKDKILKEDEISLSEFSSLLTTKDKFLIDLSKKGIGGNDNIHHIPLEEFIERMNEIPKDKEIILFCSMGIRSKIAYTILKKAGFKVRYLPTQPPF